MHPKSNFMFCFEKNFNQVYYAQRIKDDYVVSWTERGSLTVCSVTYTVKEVTDILNTPNSS